MDSALSLALVYSSPLGLDQEARTAARFPLQLPAVLSAGAEEFVAQTRNLSSSGVLFSLDRPLRVKRPIRFSLRMSGDALGASRDILVHCAGRVIRCSLSSKQYFILGKVVDKGAFPLDRPLTIVEAVARARVAVASVQPSQTMTMASLPLG